ncbi:hypothetical protein ACFE04_001336 [Oxalis oulophora]
MSYNSSRKEVKACAKRLKEEFKDVGSKLHSILSNKDALFNLLKQAESSLVLVEQSPPAPILESLQPFIEAIVNPELMKHQDEDIKLLVAACICEVTRITAPQAPYSDDVLTDIFYLIVSTFGGLNDTSNPTFGRRVAILDTLAKYRSCVVMLDLDCDDLVNEMFRSLFAVARDDHPELALSSMLTIMGVLVEESEVVGDGLLLIILSMLGRDKTNVNKAARALAMKVIEQCAEVLEPAIKEYLISSMLGECKLTNDQIDYHEVIYDIYFCAPQILTGVVPYIKAELLTDRLETRVKAVKLVGDIFTLPDSSVSKAFKPIFAEFLKRLSDSVVEIQIHVLEQVKSCLLSNPSRAEAPQILSALSDRLLDHDENIRKLAVTVICDVACHALSSVPVKTIKMVAERLQDKAMLVKKYTMERLAEIFQVYCLKCSDGSVKPGIFYWIPGNILRCFYDNDFRSETIEYVLCGSLFPQDLSIKDKSKHWVKVYSSLDKLEVKALENILEQKQRLQQEMQKYLSFRQLLQDGDVAETQKKILFCFRIMSRFFAEPATAEENFQILDQLKDTSIWKSLTDLLDANTNSHQAYSSRSDLLNMLGEKHRLYEFLSTLSVKCSYLLFNKEHVKEILLEVGGQKSARNTKYIQSCMDLLVTLAHFCPLLLGGSEEELVKLLNNDNEVIKEGVLHVLAKAGGTIREQLAVSPSSIDLVLERFCLEGNRKQAKYAVHALAAITKDEGLKSLSVLYKRLVDMLEEKTHLPAVLQSLGCIAQTAMPVFETRESEIEEFIKSKILGCNDKAEGKKSASWDARSETCLLKIYGMKTLVKSYLPTKDAHLRQGIDNLLGTLRNILTFGEISKDLETSSVDKAHLKLASAKAILRLSRQWDNNIPIDIFHSTLRTPEISFPESKKLFLNKVYHYIKDGVLNGKYACAFVLGINEYNPLYYEEEKQKLADIIQMYHTSKAQQISMQADTDSLTAYPESILPYLVHVLAHHSCPNVEECRDVEAYELIYKKLFITISMLVHIDEKVKSEGNSSISKESLSTIISIFKSIKLSDDAVDAAKSKNSHAISELGLNITKRLAPKQEDLSGLTVSVCLPSILYKPYEKKDNDDSSATEEQTWLADDNVLAHFEALKLESEETVNGKIAEDEALKHVKKDGNDLPLGNMMKQLKSKGSKATKEKKIKHLPIESGNAENDVDILKMVREINLDNMGISRKFESSNGHDQSPNKKTEVEAKSPKDTKRKVTDASPVPIPKRRRSSLGTPKSTPRGSGDEPRKRRVFLFDSIGKVSKDEASKKKKTTKSPESGVLSSQARKKKNFSSKRKAKESESDEENEISELSSQARKKKNSSSKRKAKDSESDEENEIGELSSLARKKKNSSSKRKAKESKSDEENEISESDDEENETKKNPKSPTGSVNKRKRSLAVLAKCTVKNSEINFEDMIGYRIKVWWPLDKNNLLFLLTCIPNKNRFYEGTIKSYDDSKRKHVILYDDGEVEILRLEKEQWELVNRGGKTAKKSSSLKGSPLKKVFSGQKTKTSSASRQNKKPIKSVKGKRTPKKYVNGEKGISKSYLTGTEDNKEDSDASDSKPVKPTRKSKSNKQNPDNSLEGHTEIVDENLTDKEVSENEGNSVSEGGEIPDNTDASDEAEKSDSEHSLAENMETSSQDPQKSDDEEETHFDKKEAEQDKENSEETEKSDDSGNQKQSQEKSETDDQFSDGEPLAGCVQTAVVFAQIDC